MRCFFGAHILRTWAPPSYRASQGGTETPRHPLFHAETLLKGTGGLPLPPLQITPEVHTNLPGQTNQSQLLCGCVSIPAKDRSTLYLSGQNTPGPAAAPAWLTGHARLSFPRLHHAGGRGQRSRPQPSPNCCMARSALQGSSSVMWTRRFWFFTRLSAWREIPELEASEIIATS